MGAPKRRSKGRRERASRFVLSGLFALPRGALEVILRICDRSRRVPRDGEALDTHTALVLLLARVAALPSVHTLSPAEARELVSSRYGLLDAEPRRLKSVRETRIPGAPPLDARIYTPEGLASPAPAFVYFHGGGWVVGDLDTHDAQVRLLADEARAIAVAIDYRLAPEHPFPAAAEDAIRAYRWVVEHGSELGIDRSRVAVAGDSAGGNLAAAVAQEARPRGYAPPLLQWLIYPVLDLRQAHASYDAFADGYLLTKRNMTYYIEHYLGDAGHRLDALASPLLGENLRGVSPALIVTAGHDPLCDEGHAYAERLRASGVRVTLQTHPGLVHGFLAMTGLVPAARRAVSAMTSVAAREMARPSGAAEAADRLRLD